MSKGEEERLLLPRATSDEEEIGNDITQTNFESVSSPSTAASDKEDQGNAMTQANYGSVLSPSKTSDEEEQGNGITQANNESVSSKSTMVVGKDVKKNEVEHTDSTSAGPIMEHLPHRNFISVDRFHFLLRILVVITSLILGYLSLMLAYNSLALYQKIYKPSHLQLKLKNLYVRIIKKAFGFGPWDTKEMIGPLTSFVFLVIALAIQSGVLIVAAGLHASGTIWIEECFSTFCRLLYALLIFHSICFMIWYTIFAVSLGFGLLPYLEVSPIPIGVAIVAISIGMLMRTRIIPEMA
jgi:hypothetical protein